MFRAFLGPSAPRGEKNKGKIGKIPEHLGPSWQLQFWDIILISLEVGGPAQNLPNFQMAPIPFLSVSTCSTSSPHDILKVSK